LEATKRAKESQSIVSTQNRKPSFIPHSQPTNPSPPATPLKIQKSTRVKMVERQLKGLCYNCDDNFFWGTSVMNESCLYPFMRMLLMRRSMFPSVEELPSTDDLTPPFDPPKVEPLILLHTLTGFSAPQTFKLIGYIKHRKVIILVDNRSNHNFIHCRISQEINCYIHAVNNFQIRISNDGSMKCGGRCENVRLQIGQYHLKYHMFSNDIGGCDIALDVEWLHNLVPILMDFKNLTMDFQQEGQQYKFQGITTCSPKIISSHRLEMLLKKVIMEFFPNSIPFKLLRHPMYTMTFNLYSPDTKLFLLLPMEFPLPMTSTRIPFL
jgi:hypothetical protein